MKHDLRGIVRLVILLLFAAVLPAWGAEPARPPLKTQNVVLIISDGLRWQEVFNGAEQRLMTKASGVQSEESLRKEYWRETPQERRAALFPFLWNQIGRQGQLLGNRNQGNRIDVTNGRKFSYPGYNEMLTGRADSRINSNQKTPNPNINVFEWLKERPAWGNRGVSIYGTWDVFPYIFNCQRNKLQIWPAWEPAFQSYEIQVPGPVRELSREITQIWPDVVMDAFIYEAALDQMKKKKPALIFMGFGETDEWAHENRYDLYLQSAHRVDAFTRGLWDLAQSLPEYRDKTTFILTADHGRGEGMEWKNHGERIDGAEGIWLAVIGPDTPPRGERTQSQNLTQGQIAATVAAFFNEDFKQAFPQAAAPFPGLIGSGNASNARP